ncbi:MAG TPA: universal stress protein [Kofleriaceae bacterium]|jgi:nucleotide-binding universal stress UspA family protein|nr:universal stress protein [Kofleriaceae bacterium]
MKRILVPLDHSPGSDLIVEYACALARGLAAELTLLHVYEPPNAVIAVVPGATVAGEDAAEHAAGAAMLGRCAATANLNGFDHVDRILERAESPSRAIIAHARAGKFDLIVMGTHARTGVARLLMGSVAQDVLRATTCPVLLVHLHA